MHTRHAAIFNPGRSKQRGAALIIMLVIMVMGAAAFLVSSLNSAGLKIKSDEITAAALVQAKEALIGYAVQDSNRPGELPCPDIDNDGQLTMNVDYIGNQCANLLGRLPWKTLGLPDLRDAAGERLWYAVSDPFHANSAAVLNSDTAGTLTVSGNLSASNVVAIVFAPGQNLPGQDRSAANLNTPSAYLESVVTAPTSYQQLTPNDQSLGNYTYNDQLQSITRDNLFPTVEKVVGKRAANMLNSHLSSYWGTSLYPFATPFTNPSTSLYTPSFGIDNGLLPSTAVWAGIPGYSLLPVGSATVSCSRRNGLNSLANARARCDISGVSGTPTITIIGTLDYLGLWRKYNLNSSSEVRVKYNGSNVGAATVPGMNASIAYTVNADSSVTVTFTGNIVSGVTRIELRDVVVDAANDWFTKNKWQQVMYYAVSPGYAPGGGNTCNPLPGTPSCLTVNGNGGGNNKRAVVVMTGGALAGAHPSGNLADYLEGENATPADYIYENKSRSNIFNDQVIIVAP